MDKKQSASHAVEFEDCEMICFAHNTIKAGSSMGGVKFIRSRDINAHNNAITTTPAMDQRLKPEYLSSAIFNLNGPNSRVNVCSSDSSSNSVATDNRQIFVELRQKVATIEEEGTRSQALATVDEMEKTTDLSKLAQLYQKCFGLVKSHADLAATLIKLGAAIGLPGVPVGP